MICLLQHYHFLTHVTTYRTVNVCRASACINIICAVYLATWS